MTPDARGEQNAISRAAGAITGSARHAVGGSLMALAWRGAVVGVVVLLVLIFSITVPLP